MRPHRPLYAPNYKRFFESRHDLETLQALLSQAHHLDGITIRQSRNPSDGTTVFVIQGPPNKTRAIDAFMRVHSCELPE